MVKDAMMRLLGLMFYPLLLMLLAGWLFVILWLTAYAFTYVGNVVWWGVPNPIFLAECHSEKNPYVRQYACERLAKDARE